MKLNVPDASNYSGSAFFHNSEIPLRVLHVENSRPYPYHNHDFDELVIIQGGSGSHLIDDSVYNIKRGDVFFIRKGKYHRYQDPENLNYINIIFDSNAVTDDTVKELMRNLPEHGINLRIIEENIVFSIVNRMDRELCDQKDGYNLMASSYLTQLICTLYRADTGGRKDDETDTRERVRDIIKYLENENGPEIQLTLLAEEAGTCIRNFHRIFRSLTGTSPGEFVNSIRIKRACELLSETDKTITAVAALANFSDSNYFSRQFRKITGTTPSEYRKKNRPAVAEPIRTQ